VFVALAADGRILSSVTLIGPLPEAEGDGGVWSGGAQEAGQQPLQWAVNGVWTLPAARRRGISLALLATARTWAAGEAATRSRDCLLTVIAYEANPAAVAFYVKAGFSPTSKPEPGQVELSLVVPRKVMGSGGG
jgi:GNAT superfamily N-acetyltransferase